MNLDEINEQLKQIEQMLDEIDLKKVEGKNSDEIKKMADNPIDHTNQFIQQAITKEFLKAEHLERLASIYTKTKERLSEINLEKAGEAEKNVMSKISEKADEFESKKKAYEEAKDGYDPQKNLDKEEKDRKKLQEELDNDLAIADGIELLNSRCQKHVEIFQEAYKIYQEAMKKSGTLDEDIEYEDIADEYKKEIDRIDQEIANLPPNILTDAQRIGLQNDIDNDKKELEELENNGVVGERPDPLPDKSDEYKWNKRDNLKKKIEENSTKLNSPTSQYKKKNELEAKKEQKISEGKRNYKQKQIAIYKSQIPTMNKAINSIRKDINKKEKYSEKFVAYMGDILNEAENNGEYDKFNQAITGVEKLREGISDKGKVLAKKQENIAKLQLGITQTQLNKVNEANSKGAVRRTEGSAVQTPPNNNDTKSLAVKKLTYWERRKATYEKMKEAGGKKGFRPILWLKSLSTKQIEAWEQGYVSERKVEPTEEQITKAKTNIETRREAFARSLLYDVVKQSGSNISISEDAKKRAYEAAQEVEEER